MGEKIIKRFIAFILLIWILLLPACSNDNKSSREEQSSGAVAASTIQNETVQSNTAVTAPVEGTSAAGSTAQYADENEDTAEQNNDNEQLLQSANVDLDGDGINEKVEAVQLTKSATGELEGRLKIDGKAGNREVTFCEKGMSAVSILSAMEFEDLDGDGAADVFMIIPDNGASFSFSTYFIYSLKKNKSYAFTIDNELNDFISNFCFKYSSGSKLAIINNQLSFSADLSIEQDNDQQPQEDYMKDYEMCAWIEQVPVNISEKSMVSLVNRGGENEIKIPFPIFGLATVDMIGELDLYYKIGDGFTPVLKHLEVLDFNNDEKILAGSYDIK